MTTSLRFLCNHFLCFCVLVFSFYSCKYCVFGARESASQQHANQKVSLLTASPCCTSTKGLQAANKYGPCSSLDQETPSPTSGDQSRVRSLSSTYSPGINILQEDEYKIFVVTVGFGTPTKPFKLLFDTGSHQTWVRCQSPPPVASTFDPSISSTFSAACRSAFHSCNENVTYNDHSYSPVNYVQDTISFASFTLHSMVFGCSYNQTDKGFDEVSGVLGLEPGENSLVSQKKNAFQMFCYCLHSPENTEGYLIFGKQARQTCNNPETTVSLRIKENHYLVNFVGITIDGKRLGMANSSSLSGTIFDSGTVISRLPPLVYEELKNSFQELMSRLYPHANQSSQGYENMDTCYHVGGFDASGIEDPLMILHFDYSNDLHLDTSKVVRVIGSKVCLAFAAIAKEDLDDKTIIGNHQQRNLNIYYDVPGGQIGFRGGGCRA